MDILEERYHKAPLIVTSQVEPQGWLKLFEDPVIGEAIVDRLIHPCQKITLKGDKSYREKISEKKTFARLASLKVDNKQNWFVASPDSLVPFGEIGRVAKVTSNDERARES